MEGDPLQGKEGFEAFELGWLTSFNCGESCPVLTMQGKFSSSSITGPGKKQSLCCPPSECNNERQRGREQRAERGRRLWAAGQRISHQAVHSKQLSAVNWTFHSWSNTTRDVRIQCVCVCVIRMPIFNLTKIRKQMVEIQERNHHKLVTVTFNLDNVPFPLNLPSSSAPLMLW